MQQNFNNVFLLGAAAVGIAAATLFTVDVTQQAIVLRFGQPVKVHTTAGLKAKLPWPIETVEYFDSRLLDVDPAPERVNLMSEDGQPVKAADDKETAAKTGHSGSIPIIVDTFARYRITDPLLFLQRLRGEVNAQARIEAVMNAVTRDVLGKATLSQLLSTQRTALMGQIRDRVNRDMKERGVEVVDVRIGRADLTEQLSESTVSRMIAERREEATETRAKGQEKAQEIKATAEKERTILIAQAQRDAEAMRGEGDKIAIETTTAAANEDRDFYAFIKTMFAYQNTLASPDTTLVLSPDSAFMRYFKSQYAPPK
ncbi:MAG: protease modulator HflC [Alphaproteobacteria bacterium]|nr:protease modulator HflC [Alphaproteobacteria bacterium]